MTNPGQRWRFVYTLALLWLAGAGLRFTVLAIPPVIPPMQHALRLSQTDIGVVSSLPLLLFAVAAIPGAALIARFGALPTLIGGLLITALAGAARAAVPGAWLLFATTFVMGVGVAFMQPALPPLVRDWAPHRIGLATAVYSNGMLSSEALSSALTIPFVLPLVGSSWRGVLVFWSAPLLLAAGLLALRGWRRRPRGDRSVARDPVVARRWWPNWRDARIWQVGLMMGCASGVYFGANAFLPGFLTRSGQAQWVSGALTALNATQIPATLILLLYAQRMATRRVSYVATGLVMTISVIGLVTMPGAWVILWFALIGFCAAFVITVGLALPALLVVPEDVHRFAGAVFTIAYLCAFVAPILGGWAWDVSHWSVMAFAPAGLCGLVVAGVGACVHLRALAAASTPSAAAGSAEA